MGYVIIPNQIVQACRFNLLLFRRLTQSVAAMNAVVAVQVVAVRRVAGDQP